MATKTLSARLRNATKTESEWSSSNPVGLRGEIMISSDKKMFKVGDGTSEWSALSYNSANITALKNPSALKINGKSYDGSISVDVGPIQEPYGGTGRSSVGEVPITLTETSSTSGLTSGETISTLFAKIRNIFNTLGTAAFCAKTNSVTSTSETSVLTAKGAKSIYDLAYSNLGDINDLNDEITTINSNLTELSATLSDMSHIKVYGPMIRSVTAGANGLTIVKLYDSDSITNVLNTLGCTSILGFTVTKGGYADQWQVTVTRYADNNVYAQIYSKYGSSLTADITFYMLCV